MRVERGKGNLELPGRGCDGADGRGGARGFRLVVE